MRDSVRLNCRILGVGMYAHKPPLITDVSYRYLQENILILVWYDDKNVSLSSLSQECPQAAVWTPKKVWCCTLRSWSRSGPRWTWGRPSPTPCTYPCGSTMTATVPRWPRRSLATGREWRTLSLWSLEQVWRQELLWPVLNVLSVEGGWKVTNDIWWNCYNLFLKVDFMLLR